MAKIQDFIIETDEENASVATVHRTRKTSVYSVEVSATPDFVIKRTGSSVQELVVLLSKGQIYIKGKRGITEIKADNAAPVIRFFSDLTEPIELNVNWLDKIEKENERLHNFVSLICNTNFQELAKHNLVKLVWRDMRIGYASCRLNQRYAETSHDKIQNSLENLKYDQAFRLAVTEASPYLGMEEIRMEIGDMALDHYNRRPYQQSSAQPSASAMKAADLMESMDTIRILIQILSLDGTRQFVHEWMESPHVLTFPDQGALECIQRLDCKWKASAFVEYTVYEAVRMGFIDLEVDERRNFNYRSFWNTWADTLSMQKNLTGRVAEKYPSDMLTLHNRLSMDAFVNQTLLKKKEQQKRERAIESRHNELEQYEWNPDGEDFFIRAPRSVQDILDEAGMQANCLASYVRIFAEGDTNLFFMRRKDDPDHSLITIEVRNGRVRQALGLSNRKPTDDELNFLEKWERMFGIKRISGQNRPLVA